MYAVIESGGKQYRVELGSEIQVDRMDVQPGDSITLDRVLLVADGDSSAIGRPIVDGATVSAQVLGQHRGDKIVVFKYKPKARRRVKKGFRAELTTLRISDITFAGRSAAREERTSEERASKEAQEVERAAAEQAAADRELAARLAATEATSTEAGSVPDAAGEAGASTRKPRSRARAGTGSKASAGPAKDRPGGTAKAGTKASAQARPEPVADAKPSETEPTVEADRIANDSSVQAESSADAEARESVAPDAGTAGDIGTQAQADDTTKDD